MLDEYKNLYVVSADKIENWRDIDKNILCNRYIDEKNQSKKDSYLSAIICKYWNSIQKYYYISNSIATEEDVYEWLIESIMYALEHASWRNPQSSIYNDPNGPDKVINRCMKCRRLTFYQCHNRKKRKDAFSNVSLDEIKENYNENTAAITDESESHIDADSAINYLIKKAFDKQQYMTAVIIDIIAFGNSITLEKEKRIIETSELGDAKKYADFDEAHAASDDEEDTTESECQSEAVFHARFNLNDVVKKIKYISADDASYFAHRYNIPEQEVTEKIIKYCAGNKTAAIKERIFHTLETLKTNFILGGTLDVN